MAFHHNPHDLEIEAKEIENLQKEVGSPAPGSPGWHRWVEFVFISSDNIFIAHDDTFYSGNSHQNGYPLAL